MKLAIVFAALMLTAAAARAQPVSGFYVQGNAGLTLPQQQSITLPSTGPGTPQNSAAANADAAISSKLGPAESGSAGWGFGNGLRMEIEGVHTTQGGGATN
jgi:OmpA-OmpF porin, OOP family